MNSAAQTPNTDNVSGAIVPEADLHCHILPDWDDGPETLEPADHVSTVDVRAV